MPAPPAAPAIHVTGFPADAAEGVAESAEHLNDDHGDTVLLVARFAAGAADAAEAWIAAVSPTGIELVVDAPAGPRTCRAAFADPVDVDGLYGQLMALVGTARTAAGDAVPPTSVEREQAQVAGLRTYLSRVAAVRDLSPSLRELTLRGGLEGFPSAGGDQFCYLITGAPGGAPLAPGFSMADHMAAPEADRAPAAYYTVRRWRPEAGEMDLWVVLHGHDAGVGGWAAAVQPGTPVALWGPRTAFERPAGTARLLLCGDETALPAIAAILEERPAEQPAAVVVEVAGPAHEVDLPVRPGDDLVWAHRSGAPGTGTALLDAVRALELDGDGLAAFGAAETRQIAEVRAHLRGERGLPAAQVRMTGYWRRRG